MVLYTYHKCKVGEVGNYIEFEDDYIRVERNGTHYRKYKNISLMALRKCIKSNQPDWFNEPPSHLLDQAINEGCIKYKTNLKLRKPFKMSFKSKRDIKHTMNVEAMAFSKSKNSFYPKFLGNIKSSEKFKDMNLLGSSISCNTVLNEWFLNAVHKKSVKETLATKVCALDPGVNIFMSMYSPTEVIQFGTDASKCIQREAKKLDEIQSQQSQSNHKKRQELRKRLHRQIKRIRNKRDDLHWKIINYLTLNYKTIILPDFKTSQMVSKLHSKVARSMNTLSFFQFKQRMITKCEERKVNLIIGDESYTTKTCTCCGIVDASCIDKITRLYHCKTCGIELDRDIVGSRNIYLKHTYQLCLEGKLVPKSIFG
jgi:putative transposase